MQRWSGSWARGSIGMADERNSPLRPGASVKRACCLQHLVAGQGRSVNRDQVRDAASIMGHVVPAVIDVMMSGANEIWGDPCYPVVD